MRILHVYSGNLFGGIERLLITIARERSPSLVIEHSFALCFDGRLSEELRTLGAEVYELNSVRFRRPWSVWSARRRLRAILLREKFDLVLAHSCWSQILAFPVARSTGLPSIFWVHDAMGDGHWLDRMVRYRPPRLCIANSRYTRESVLKALPSVECVVQHLPVPAPEQVDRAAVRKQVRTELGVSDEVLVIVMASRFERWKGHGLLLSSLANIKSDRAWECWIAGGVQRPEDAKFLAELKGLVIQFGLESKVRWLGERRDVPRIFTAADIHCQPNLSPEAFGIAFVEAMYCGLPVATAVGGGPDELVDASCGIMVPAHDPVALSVALTQLLEDDALRQRLGTAGPARARRLCEPTARLYELQHVFASVLHPNDPRLSHDCSGSAAAKAPT